MVRVVRASSVRSNTGKRCRELKAALHPERAAQAHRDFQANIYHDKPKHAVFVEQLKTAYVYLGRITEQSLQRPTAGLGHERPASAASAASSKARCISTRSAPAASKSKSSTLAPEQDLNEQQGTMLVVVCLLMHHIFIVMVC